MCYWPKLIENKKYHPNKKNGGYVDYEKMLRPDFDKRVLAVPIGCGKCQECRKAKAREWQVRLLEDVRHNTNGIFVTLTLSNEEFTKLAKDVTQKKTKEKIIEKWKVNEKGKLEPIYKGKRYVDKNGKLRIRYKYRITTEEIKLKGYETDNAIAKLAIRRMMERWRKKFKKSARHWLITELGHKGTENIHLHGFIWTDESPEEIRKIWDYGFVWIGSKKTNGRRKNYVNEKTVNYCTKYVHKVDFDHKEYKPIILTSAGIGKGYFSRTDWEKNKYQEGKTKEYYTTKTGHKMALPIYWRNKIYNDEEREKLWLEKLDKQMRYVGGEAVNTKDGMKEYYSLLEYYRKKNNRLGYGTGTTDWNQKKYEEERRILLQQERITKIEFGQEPSWVNEKSEAGIWTDRWLERLEE